MKQETKCLHSGYVPKNGEPRQMPIYQSTTFKYDSSDAMGRLFDLEDSGYFYTRLQNPSNDMTAAKIADLEGGVAAMLTSSGQAANFFALFNICETGSHIVASSAIYGGTYNLLGVTMKKMGIDVTFVDQNLPEEELAKAFKPNTRAMFGETITNPTVSVLDIEKFAHENGRKYHVTVATSDGLEQIIITGQGCHLLSAREFEREVEAANQTLREAIDGMREKSSNHILGDALKQLTDEKIQL